jgi:GNAT superfamily N-acetyltransferase
MITGFSIRKAMPEDAQALPAIEQDAGERFAEIDGLEAFAGGDNLPPEFHLRRIAEGSVWVAIDAAGSVVGFLTAEAQGDELHIHELDVARRAQGLGLGRALVAAAEDEARGRGFAALTLTTFTDVAWNAPYYAGLGFTAVSGDDLGAHLLACVEEERRKGFPMQRRCAMRRAL